MGGIPTIALDYSPAWDANLFEWTQGAINRGFRGQLREEFQILTYEQDGLGPAYYLRKIGPVHLSLFSIIADQHFCKRSLPAAFT